MRIRIRSALSLFPEFVASNTDYFPCVHPNEVKSGLLSLVMSETVANLSVRYLTYVVYLLERGFSKVTRVPGQLSVSLKNKGNGEIVTRTYEYRDF